MDLAALIRTATPKKNEVALFSLGQAGFLLKGGGGTIFVIDPCLTDCGERLRGFKRLAPKLISPFELEPDIYLTTHLHFDHFDYDAIPIIGACRKTLFCGPGSCMNEFAKIGFAKDKTARLEAGMTLEHHGVRVTATYADHSDMAPDAVGAFVEMDGHRFYFTGDTAYHQDYFHQVAMLQPDVAVISINGEYGNMNAEESARAAKDIGAGTVIPCHFWMFAEHQGNPLEFRRKLKNYAPGCRLLMLSQGEQAVFCEVEGLKKILSEDDRRNLGRTGVTK
ncbi:hypothetical protein FACS189460_4700 [Deltaproteobacteria bacterium]|nr:hypothetical protein FACS189460_4700 [Deltaproteobacteria bacterium]